MIILRCNWVTRSTKRYTKANTRWRKILKIKMRIYFFRKNAEKKKEKRNYKWHSQLSDWSSNRTKSAGWFGREFPFDEVVDGSNIRPVVLLWKLPEFWPCEIRVLPWLFSTIQLLWGSHHSVLSWRQKESNRFPLQIPVHRCSMQATLVPPIA